jgi:hypothetical protein
MYLTQPEERIFPKARPDPFLDDRESTEDVDGAVDLCGRQRKRPGDERVARRILD